MQNNHHSRSLRTLILFYGGVILIILSVAFAKVTTNNMTNMLLRVESEYIEKQLDVLNAFFSASENHIYLIAEDMGVWEETVQFIQGSQPGYIQENWPEGSVVDAYGVDFLLLRAANGEIRYEETAGDYGQEMISESLARQLRKVADDVLAQYDQAAVLPEKLGKGGMMLVDGLPYLIVTAPVMMDKTLQQPEGTVTFGIALDEAYFRETLQVDPLDFSFSLDDGETEEGVIVGHFPETSVRAVSLIDGVDGTRIVLQVSSDNALYAQGERTIHRTAIAIFLLMLEAVVAISFGVHWLLRPLDRLVGAMGKVQTGELLDISQYSRVAELKKLSVSVNQMLERLNQSQVSLDILQSILDEMDAFIFVSDPQTGEILFINKKMVEHFGLDDDVVGQPCWSALQIGMRQQCDECPLARLLSGEEKTVVWEHLNPLTGRLYRKVDSLIRWNTGKDVHLQFSVDITEQKQNEQSLKTQLVQQELMSSISQSFLSTEPEKILIERALQMAGEMLDASRLILVQADADGKMIHWKYAWFDEKDNIARRSTTESFPMVEGNVMYDAFIVQKLPYVLCNDTREMPALEAERFGVKSCMIFPLYRAGQFWGAISVDDCRSCRQWGSSDVRFLQLLGNVISELIFRERTQAELQRMSAIVNHSPLSIVYIGENGGIEYVNQGTVTLTGYSREELKERGIYALLDEQTGRRVREEILPAILERNQTSFELSMIRRDGEIRQLLISVFSVRSGDYGLGIIATDITEMHQMEEALIQAKEQAERSNSAKSEFLSRMSHEMRTPMNAIIGMTSIAKSSDTLERKDYCLDKIENASNHLLGVINDILDMSKIEAGKFELSYTSFAMEKILTRVSNVVDFRMEQDHLDFQIHLDPAVPKAIISDEQRLAQVVTNLLSNAMKFTPQGGRITLDIRFIEQQGDRCELEISVTDTGIGIAKEQQKQLFQQFEQLDGSITRKFGGTGLGLAISKKIVEMMDGHIWVESEEGKGSRFAFRFKAQQETSVQKMDAPETDVPETMQEDDFTDAFCGKYLLLAEDVALNQEILIALLEPTGIAVDCADDGRQVYTMFQQNPERYDLIFMDIHMPEVDGYEATRMIRELEADRAKTIPIVAMTANVFREDIERCLQAGMNAHIGKPLDIQEVMQVLHRFLGTKK